MTQPVPAPALNCGHCRRQLGKTVGHLLIGAEPYSPDRLLCTHCMSPKRTVAQSLHGRYYPDCGDAWHDLYDHPIAHATRAAAAHLLGLWPNRPKETE
jgi:hypothetical protein